MLKCPFYCTGVNLGKRQRAVVQDGPSNPAKSMESASPMFCNGKECVFSTLVFFCLPEERRALRCTCSFLENVGEQYIQQRLEYQKVFSEKHLYRKMMFWSPWVGTRTITRPLADQNVSLYETFLHQMAPNSSANKKKSGAGNVEGNSFTIYGCSNEDILFKVHVDGEWIPEFEFHWSSRNGYVESA